MVEFREERKCMGTQFELVIHHNDTDFAQKMLEEGYSEIERIEDLLSEFRSHSQVSKVNQLAGTEASVVDEEVLNLFLRSLKISEITSMRKLSQSLLEGKNIVHKTIFIKTETTMLRLPNFCIFIVT